MNIAELAERAGVKVSTLRFYERRGVLPEPPRTTSGYRDFDEEDLTRVRYLRRGQQLGFTLAELDELTALSGTRVVIAGDVAARGRDKLAEIDARIADLAQLRGALADLLAQQCTDPDEPCPIMHALGSDEASASR